MSKANQNPFSYHTFKEEVAKRKLDINSEFTKIMENQEYKESIKEKLTDFHNTILDIQTLIIREISLRGREEEHLLNKHLIANQTLGTLFDVLTKIQIEFTSIMSEPGRDFRNIFEEDEVLNAITQISEFNNLITPTIGENDADLKDILDIQRAINEKKEKGPTEFIKKTEHLQNVILEIISGEVSV